MKPPLGPLTLAALAGHARLEVVRNRRLTAGQATYTATLFFPNTAVIAATQHTPEEALLQLEQAVFHEASTPRPPVWASSRPVGACSRSSSETRSLAVSA